MAKKASMDSIDTPDLEHLDKKQYENLNTYDRYSRKEDYSEKVRVSFTEVSPKSLDFKVSSKEEPEVDGEAIYNEFSTKSTRDARSKRAAGPLDQGVLVNGSYVARKYILRFVMAVLIVAAFVLLFVPPAFAANDSESGCRYEDIFAEKGSSQYKTEILGRGYVYNIDALSSDLSENYRICTVAFDVNNFLPVPVEIKDYAIAFGGDFKDHIVYSYADNDAKNIPSMTKKTIHINILVNKAGLSDGEFDRAVTSVTLKTVGMKKFGVIPCIPSVMSVSDVISFDPS